MFAILDEFSYAQGGNSEADDDDYSDLLFDAQATLTQANLATSPLKSKVHDYRH